jgi:hypothetical protein
VFNAENQFYPIPKGSLIFSNFSLQGRGKKVAENKMISISE